MFGCRGEDEVIDLSPVDRQRLVDGVLCVGAAFEAEAARRVPLRIDVDDESGFAGDCQRSGQIDRRGRLAYPALLIRYRYHL
jgi:hypothetical protein